jgi:hypothetical protein
LLSILDTSTLMTTARRRPLFGSPQTQGKSWGRSGSCSNPNTGERGAAVLLRVLLQVWRIAHHTRRSRSVGSMALAAPPSIRPLAPAASVFHVFATEDVRVSADGVWNDKVRLVATQSAMGHRGATRWRERMSSSHRPDGSDLKGVRARILSDVQGPLLVGVAYYLGPGGVPH